MQLLTPRPIRLDGIKNPEPRQLDFLYLRFDHFPLEQKDDSFQRRLESLLTAYRISAKADTYTEKLNRIAHFTRDYLQIPNHVFQDDLEDLELPPLARQLDDDDFVLQTMRTNHQPLYEFHQKRGRGDPDLIWQVGRDQLYREYLQSMLTFGKSVQ